MSQLANLFAVVTNLFTKPIATLLWDLVVCIQRLPASTTALLNVSCQCCCTGYVWNGSVCNRVTVPKLSCGDGCGCGNICMRGGSLRSNCRDGAVACCMNVELEALPFFSS